MDPADEVPHPDNDGWLLCFAHLPVLACFASDFTITLLGTIVSPAWVLTKCGFGLSGNPEVSSADVAMVLAYGGLSASLVDYFMFMLKMTLELFTIGYHWNIDRLRWCDLDLTVSTMTYTSSFPRSLLSQGLSPFHRY